MSHYYAKISRSARKHAATARGHKSTGLEVIAACFDGAIKVNVGNINDRDYFVVTLVDWSTSGAGATRKVLATGHLDD